MNKKLALCLQGISYNKDYTSLDNYTSVNYKTCIDSIKINLIKVLEKDLKVDVFLNTYESELKEDLINDYKPTGYKFIEQANLARPREQNYVLKNLKNSCDLLLLKENFFEEYDFVLITRFDCYFYQPLNTNLIQFDKMNYCWLGEDNFFLFPSSMLKKFRDAVEMEDSGGLCVGAHGLYARIHDLGMQYNSMFSHEELINFQKEFPNTRCFYTIHRYIEKIPNNLIIWNSN